MKNNLILLISLFSIQILFSQQNNSSVTVSVTDIKGNKIKSIDININHQKLVKQTNEDGVYVIGGLPSGSVSLVFSKEGYREFSKNINLKESESKKISVVLYKKDEIEEVEIQKYGTFSGIETLTRLPIKIQEMPQAISVISEETIKEQGGMSVASVVQNVPGISLFSSYGGVRESMTIRGYRGTPTLKNGIQIDSDFRTASILTDMQGVESIQVIRGATSLTQGIGDGLGSPGGVINIVTKTPKFIDQTVVDFRTGSWGLIRPTLDFQKKLDNKNIAAVRFNAAYELDGAYKKDVDKDRIYFNPSFEIRLDPNTRFLFEMDYFKANTTPDYGTVNLASDDIYALYEMPKDKFMGFSSDNVENETFNYGVRAIRKLTEKLSLNASYFSSQYNVDSQNATFSKVAGGSYSMRRRNLVRSEREDQNTVFQLDIMGKEIQTWKIKHSFQVGFDYKTTRLKTTNYNSFNGIDVIDVLAPTINNELPGGYVFNVNKVEKTHNYSYGIVARDVIEFNKYLRILLGTRYNSQESKMNDLDPIIEDSAWDPFFGIMVNLTKNINLYGSYTTTSSLRSAHNKDKNGKDMGPSVSKQCEVGFKSSWLNNSLVLITTYFDIRNSDLQYGISFSPGAPVAYYIFAGDLKRKGVEVEVTGKITPQLKTMLGYSYLDARYENSPAYVDGSRPMNTPQNTFNAWVQYKFDSGILKNLSIGSGVYYVGDRPVNDWGIVSDNHGSVPGLKPFSMPSFTTVNLQLGYEYRSIQAKVFLNNIFDELGYNSYYRAGYINQIDPRNFGMQISYLF